MTGTAVLRADSHAPVVLHGTPAAATECRPGEVTIVLGYDSYGQPVILVVTSLEWADDLLRAALDAAARGAVRAGMTRTLPAVTA